MKIDTFEAYHEEFDYQSLFSAKNDNQEVGLSFVFKSMTDRQKDIIRLIA